MMRRTSVLRCFIYEFCYLRERHRVIWMVLSITKQISKTKMANPVHNVYGWINLFTTIIGYNQRFLAWLYLFDDCVVAWVMKSADTTIERICNFEYQIRDGHQCLVTLSTALRYVLTCGSSIQSQNSRNSLNQISLEVMGQLDIQSCQCPSDSTLEWWLTRITKPMAW